MHWPGVTPRPSAILRLVSVAPSTGTRLGRGEANTSKHQEILAGCNNKGLLAQGGPSEVALLHNVLLSGKHPFMAFNTQPQSGD